MQESRRQRPGSGRVCGCAECLQAVRKQKHIPNTEDGRLGGLRERIESWNWKCGGSAGMGLLEGQDKMRC